MGISVWSAVQDSTWAIVKDFTTDSVMHSVRWYYVWRSSTVGPVWHSARDSILVRDSVRESRL